MAQLPPSSGSLLQFQRSSSCCKPSCCFIACCWLSPSVNLPCRLRKFYLSFVPASLTHKRVDGFRTLSRRALGVLQPSTLFYVQYIPFLTKRDSWCHYLDHVAHSPLFLFPKFTSCVAYFCTPIIGMARSSGKKRRLYSHDYVPPLAYNSTDAKEAQPPSRPTAAALPHTGATAGAGESGSSKLPTPSPQRPSTQAASCSPQCRLNVPAVVTPSRNQRPPPTVSPASSSPHHGCKKSIHPVSASVTFDSVNNMDPGNKTAAPSEATAETSSASVSTSNTDDDETTDGSSLASDGHSFTSRRLDSFWINAQHTIVTDDNGNYVTTVEDASSDDKDDLEADEKFERYHAFTNALGVDLDGDRTTAHVENPRFKATFDPDHEYTPSDALMGLLLRWSRKPRNHFYHDALNTVLVLSQELGMEITEFLSMKGWRLTTNRQTKDTSQDYTIRYSSIKECLEYVSQGAVYESRFSRLASVLDRLYERVGNTESMLLWKSGIDAAGEFQPSIHKDQNTDPDPDDLPPLTPWGPQGNDTRPVPKRPKKKRRYDTNHKLLTVHQVASFRYRINFAIQHLQLAFSLVQTIFLECLTAEERKKKNSALGLFHKIFYRCETRRMFVESLLDIVMRYPSKKAQNQKLLETIRWVQSDPRTILDKVRSAATRESKEEFWNACAGLGLHGILYKSMTFNFEKQEGKLVRWREIFER